MVTELVSHGKAAALLIGLAGIESNSRTIWELHDQPVDHAREVEPQHADAAPAGKVYDIHRRRATQVRCLQQLLGSIPRPGGPDSQFGARHRYFGGLVGKTLERAPQYFVLDLFRRRPQDST